MIHEVLRVSSLPRAGNPKRPFFNCHSKTPRSRGVGTLRVTEQLTERKRHHVISVHHHLTKNLPGLPQKSSETPSTALLEKKGEGPKDAAAHKGRGPKDPAAQTLNGVVALFQAPTRLLRQLLVHEQDRCGHGSSPSRQAAIPLRSRDFDPGTRRHAFGLWASLRHPIFTTGSMPFWLADAEKETTALSVLFSFRYLLRLFPRNALHTALSGHWPFAGDSEAPDWQPMALRIGTPEWADSLFQGRDRGLRVALSAAQYEFDGFPEAVF